MSIYEKLVALMMPLSNISEPPAGGSSESI
jgi:hypothetical protein